jgi:peptide/nickel transport system substrate-binding protein
MLAICAGMSVALVACTGSNSDNKGSNGGGGGKDTGAATSAAATSGGASTSPGGAVKAAFNAGNESIVNPSKKKGGTLAFADSDEPDSTDPGDMYYAMMWNLSRLYGRALMTFKPAPGKAGLQLVPDLATGPGQVSKDKLTWTYHIRPGIKYEDGSPVTTKDIKYAVERSNYDKVALPNGPSYFAIYLQDPTYPGPYKDKAHKDKLGLTSILTPNDTTIVFKLVRPFADFDFVASMPQTYPVPPAHDTGAKYKEHPWSTGPYKFTNYSEGKGYTLVRNTYWDPKTDPIRTALPDKITMTYHVDANDIDSKLLSGDFDTDVSGTGVQAAARAKILQDPALKADADAAPSGFLWTANLALKVKPFDNIHCRKAVEYAVNKTDNQTAYGGPLAGGPIASTVLPTSVLGYQKFDMYEATSKPTGDVDKAKNELKLCGKPNGFTTNIAARGDRPKEVAAAEAIQNALKRVGIKTEIQKYPHSTYFGNFAGVPTFVKSHDLGIMMFGWAADWPTGFGFLSQIADGRAIKPAGNNNLSGINDPTINGLLDKAMATNDANGRNTIYSQIDKMLMEQAVFVPEVYATSLLYRPSTVSNVYLTQAYGMYDYIAMGKK